jgi:hypothetical protein
LSLAHTFTLTDKDVEQIANALSTQGWAERLGWDI